MNEMHYSKSTFNKSLITGCVPASFKKALIRPLLKKVGLDAGNLKSFQLVISLQVAGEGDAG